MKNLKISCALIVLLLSTGALAQQGQAKVAIEKAWAEMDKAMVNFDGAGSIKYMRDDFEMTFAERPGMSINKPMLRSVMTQKLPQIKKAGGKLSSSTRVRSMEKLDESRVKVQTVSEGTEQESKADPAVQVVEDREEVWVQSGGSWGCQSIHVVKTKRS